MNQKQRQRVGSAIASTILSYAAVSLAVVDKAQAAVLTYNFAVGGGPSSFFKFNNSSLRGIGNEEIAVSEGKLNNFTASFGGGGYQLQGKEYYNLAGAIALFYQGEFRGLLASGNDSSTTEINTSYPGEPGGPYYIKYQGSAFWSMATNGRSGAGIWKSYFSGYRQMIVTPPNDRQYIIDRTIINDREVSYSLVDTAPEPVPEPVTVAGTALALAGLSWLKHQKKMAA